MGTLFTQQLHDWLQRNGVNWCIADVETATYRLRTMISQLRNFATAGRKDGSIPQVPARWSNLGFLLELIDKPITRRVTTTKCFFGYYYLDVVRGLV